MNPLPGNAVSALAWLACAVALTACERAPSPAPVPAPPPPAPVASASSASAAAATAATAADVRMDRVAVDALSFDLPLYPGATVEGGLASRIALPTGTTWMVTLRSADAPHQLLGFYRDAMRARQANSPSAEFAEFSDGDTLVLADPSRGLAVQLQVSPQASGSVAQIVDTRAAR